MKYYTPLIVIVWLSLAILCILAIENDRFSKNKKRILFFSYGIVALAALFEWLGVILSLKGTVNPSIIKVFKYFDYLLLLS